MNWASRQVGSKGSLEERIRRLHTALLDVHRLREIRFPTETADQAFTHRRANCVSFAHLFVTLSRELGIPTYFLLTRQAEAHERRGDLQLAYRHLTAGFGPPGARVAIDFGGVGTEDIESLEPVPDATAIAIFHSNRGAEHLLAKRWLAAVEWLETATHLDPALGFAWTNLGIALRHAGRPEDSVIAFGKALQQGHARAARGPHSGEAQVTRRQSSDGHGNGGAEKQLSEDREVLGRRKLVPTGNW